MTFTIVTPTYNRVELLRRCYESLARQTLLDFEWLVVDDGSTDSTPDALVEWAGAAPFPIRLIRQPNGGKHRALNRALDGDLREYTLLLDSDDALAEHAIERLTRTTEMIQSDQCAGIIGNRHDMRTGQVVGRPVPDGVHLSTGRELRERYGVLGDTLRVYRSEVLKRYRFPDFSDERFVPENVVFDPIDKDHRIAVVGETIYLCDYQRDGLSAGVTRLRALNPRGFAASLESSAWVARRPVEVIKNTLKYQVWCRQFFGDFGRSDFRRAACYWLCLPAAALLNRLHRPAFIFATRGTVPRQNLRA